MGSSEEHAYFSVFSCHLVENGLSDFLALGRMFNWPKLDFGIQLLIRSELKQHIHHSRENEKERERERERDKEDRRTEKSESSQ